MLRNTFITIFSLLLVWSGASSAAIVQINSSASVIHTSGGLTGFGYGDLSISGSFTIAEDGGLLLFENIDVVVTPVIFNVSSASLPLPIDVTYDGLSFTTTPFYCVAMEGVYCPTDNIIGSYDGVDFFMSRLFFSGIPDDYSYDISIVGTVSAVPVPAAIWLFGSGLIGLIGFVKRKRT